jgi:hypothetical protein
MFSDSTYKLKGAGANSTLMDRQGEEILSVDYDIGEIVEATKDEVARDENAGFDIIDSRSGEVAYRAVYSKSGSQLMNMADVEVSILDVDSGDVILSARTSTEGYASVGVHSGDEKIGVVTNHRLVGLLLRQSRLPMGLSMYEPDNVGDDSHRISWSDGSVKEKLLDNVEEIYVSEGFGDKEVAVLGLLAASMALDSEATYN